MRRRRLAVVAAALVGLAAATGPAAAQACGPLTFGFSTTGAGCDPFGPGPVPALSSTLFLLPGNPNCPVRIQLNSNVVLFPIPIATLVLGLSSPGVPLVGYPGCTLWTSPDFFLPMGPDAGGPTLHAVLIVAPPDPSLIGASIFAQAALPVPGVGVRISNGIRIDIT